LDSHQYNIIRTPDCDCIPVLVERNLVEDNPAAVDSPLVERRPGKTINRGGLIFEVQLLPEVVVEDSCPVVHTVLEGGRLRNNSGPT
jgi:hypothetical protein